MPAALSDRYRKRLFARIECHVRWTKGNRRIFAHANYQGTRLAAALSRTGRWTIEIVRRSHLPRFEVLPKLWIVERTLAWITRCRHLAKDFECQARIAAAFIRLAMIRLMLRRSTASSL